MVQFYYRKQFSKSGVSAKPRKCVCAATTFVFKQAKNVSGSSNALFLFDGYYTNAAAVASASITNDTFVYTAHARKGWMVPNQYWVPGALAPMPIMGKYYMYYGNEFLPPRELGQLNAQRMKAELIIDNMGFCRFHRNWAEEMIPDIVGSLWGLKDEYLNKISMTASRINARNASVYWESERNIDYVFNFLKRKQIIDKNDGEDFKYWLKYFEKDKNAAALDFWYEMHKGTHKTLCEF